ncbi:hypothetical protein SAMN05421594_1303 [Chryseobacterium oleae]|uniref:Uncharacterized protein n=1 Tax=Chryseobacterium oleae TaxID=491207 RepID=A0A1I4WLA1_CHROL|nr:hypothetical protein SAMN05421594_1303 [Chryseobacterium oleae]
MSVNVIVCYRERIKSQDARLQTSDFRLFYKSMVKFASQVNGEF